MTEAEWLACANPMPMLDFLRGKASDRKLWLFACACCRQVWPLFSHAPSRSAIEVAERVESGAAGRGELMSAFLTVDGLFDPDGEPNLQSQLACAVCDEKPHAAWVVHGIEQLLRRQGGTARSRQRAKVSTVQPPPYPNLLRDIFGNPFRPSFPLPVAVLSWNDRLVPRLAQAIYAERQLPAGTLDTARLAMLADALLDAVCDDEELIRHCRSEGPHVRGCWAVDLILGKT
jgi:hypothetical protein